MSTNSLEPNPDPDTVILVPGGPVAGEATTVGPLTTKLVELVASPPGVFTWMGPVNAPCGTVAVIWVQESTVYTAAVALNFTPVAPVNAVPVMVTEDPTCPDGGLNPVMVGTTLKMDAEVAVPAGMVTEMGPVVAPVGTLVVIFVSE